MTWLCLIVAVVGLALFGLADPAHYGRRFGAQASTARSRRMRAAGWVTLIAVLPLAIATQGPVFGPVVWIGILILAAGIVWLALNFLPEVKRKAR